jgi:glycosyltransferase involved in cell wall biosynthesis
MKTLMVISQFHPIIGGTENQAKILAQKLIEKGIDVDIITGWWKFGTPRKEMIDSVRVFRNFSCWRMFGIKGIRTLGVLIYMMSLGIYLIRHGNKYDMIHVHQVLYPAFVSVFLGKKFLKKSVLVKNTCSGLTNEINQLKNIPLGEQQLRYLVKNMDLLVVLNLEAEKEFKAMGYPGAKIVRVPNGVAISAASKNTYGEVVQVLLIARLDRQKGIDILIRAWAKATRTKSVPKLIILGDGPQAMELRNLVKSLGVTHSIEFKGIVRNVEEYLRNADLFILPSRAEGLSNALLEAMSYGIPCIATNVGGNPEVFGMDENRTIPLGGYVLAKNGILVNPDDAKGLCDAILYLIRDARAREEMGKRGRLFIQENYSIDLIADRYIALYRRMMEGKV